MTRVTAEQLATARGCVLGLIFGDAIGAIGGNVPASGTLRATSAGQLACFTVDGLIRTPFASRIKSLPTADQCLAGALDAPDRDPEIDLADRSLGRFAVLSWPFNPPVDRLAARA
ncbi:hypothetical protein [Micromonospora sp. DT47]|uniref:hypothetical protein n=1 Tax=Micromonospora sp. DT47 TaxID=3393431 RepID=UPI003CF0A1CB